MIETLQLKMECKEPEDINNILNSKSKLLTADKLRAKVLLDNMLRALNQSEVILVTTTNDIYT